MSALAVGVSALALFFAHLDGRENRDHARQLAVDERSFTLRREREERNFNARRNAYVEMLVAFDSRKVFMDKWMYNAQQGVTAPAPRPFVKSRQFRILAQVTIFGSEAAVNEAVGFVNEDRDFYRAALGTIIFRRQIGQTPSKHQLRLYRRQLRAMDAIRQRAQGHLEALGGLTREEFQHPERLTGR